MCASRRFRVSVASVSGSAPYVVRVVVGGVPGVGGADEVDDQLVGGQGPVRGGRWAGRAVVDLDPEGQSRRLDRSQRGPAHAHPYSTRFEDLHPVGDQPAGGVVVVVQVASRGALHSRQPIGLQRAWALPAPTNKTPAAMVVTMAAAAVDLASVRVVLVVAFM